MNSGKLYLVPTPIGNLRDITFRAIEVLKSCDIILAEDTRKTSILLNHYNINTKLLSHHKFNEHIFIDKIIERLKRGENIALVSDAGTPGISDPGFLLTRECIKNEIEVEALPGASAFLPALLLSGFPCDRFCFEGFLPQKKGRHSRLKELASETRTMIFYESPYKLLGTIEAFKTYFGENRRASVSKELTKIYEQSFRGNLNELVNFFKGKTLKGEYVIVVEGKKEL
jgi:16S rRNA (cytidine1402-2'-O)-methyltransferase